MIGWVGVVLLLGMTLPARLSAQQQDPRPADTPSARPTTDLSVRAGQPATSGAGQPARLPQGGSPASADRPFDTWTVALPYRQAVTIWARNPAADTIVITEFSLSDCFNLATPCGPTDLHLALGPGDSAEVITLRPKVWNDQFTYRPGWRWTFPANQRMAADNAGDEPPLPLAVWAQSDSARREVVLMARNTSTESVIVTGLRLADCENIAGGGCGAHPLDLRLAPGDSAAAVVLKPKRWGDPFRINLKWEWTWATRDR
jgi:hypothetical protein